MRNIIINVIKIKKIKIGENEKKWFYVAYFPLQYIYGMKVLVQMNKESNVDAFDIGLIMSCGIKKKITETGQAVCTLY